MSKTINIIHFNDVYNIEPMFDRKNGEIIEMPGGAARFVTAIRKLNNLDPLILFGGDIFSPSLMSTITKGKQMVPIINTINVHCAVFGNHDFDFGVSHLIKFVDLTPNTTWLISNVVDAFTGEPLANGKVKHVVLWNQIKIGIIGLVELDWLYTLPCINSDDVIFVDPVKKAKILCDELKKDDGVDVIIALTHMRWPNDTLLAEEVNDIDIILGGHDHDYRIEVVNGKYIVKSGTEFREFSNIELKFSNGKCDFDIEKVSVDVSIDEDKETKQIVDSYLSVIDTELDKVLGTVSVDLEGRFLKIRTQETNLGNLLCDIMLEATDAHIAILNSGSIRSDRIHSAGNFTLRDLQTIIPIKEDLVVLEISGENLLQVLENGVSKFPVPEGRFLQVSGVQFQFDPKFPPGSRIRKCIVHGKPLDLDKVYRLCTKSYLAKGKDGYDVLKTCKVIVDEENCMSLRDIIRNHFDSIKALKKEIDCPIDSEVPFNQHRQFVMPKQKVRKLSRQVSIDLCVDQIDSIDNNIEGNPDKLCEYRHAAFQRRKSISINEWNHVRTHPPSIENRIICL